MNAVQKWLSVVLCSALVACGGGGGGSAETVAESAALADVPSAFALSASVKSADGTAVGSATPAPALSGSAAAEPAVASVAALTTTSTATPTVAASVSVTATAPDLVVAGLHKLSETRVSRTVYDYVFAVEVLNQGSAPALPGTLRLTAAGAGSSVIDSQAVVPVQAAGARSRLADTVTVRHDRTRPFDAAALVWVFDPSLPPAAFKGRFIDKPVEGLAWRTASRSGLTDGDGQFAYDSPGETVWFSVGGLLLGQAQAQASVHVSDLMATPEAQWLRRNDRVAQLLQSVDELAGQGAVIRIPLVLRQPANPLRPPDFAASQALFDQGLKTLLADTGLPASQFVPLEQAARNADALKTTTLALCPFEMPTHSPNNLGPVPPQYRFDALNLTCQQRAALHFYVQRVLPQIKAGLDGQNERLGLIESTFTAEAVAKMLESNVVIQALGAADTAVGALNDLTEELDEEKSALTAKAAAAVVSQSTKAIQAVVSFLLQRVQIRPGLTGDQLAEASLRSASFADELSSLFVDGTSCLAVIAGDKDASERMQSCLDAAASVVNTYVAGSKLLKGDAVPFNQEEFRQQLKTAASTVAIAVSALELSDAALDVAKKPKSGKAIRDLKRAGFGLLGAVNDAASNGLKLAAMQPGSALQGGGGQFLIGVLDRAVAPTLEVAEACWRNGARGGKNLGLAALKQLTIDKANCATKAAKVLVDTGANAVMALVGNVAAVRQAGRQAELLVVQAVLEEYLWNGGDWGRVKARYGLTDGDGGASGWDLTGLVIEIGEKRMGFNPVLTYVDVVGILRGAVWDGANSFNFLSAKAEVRTYLNMMVNQRSVDLVIPSLQLSVSQTAGQHAQATLRFDPSALPAGAGMVRCHSPRALSPRENTPFTEFFSAPGEVTFELRHATPGQKLLLCSVYAAGGYFIGSRTVAFELTSVPLGELVVSPAEPTAMSLVQVAFANVLEEVRQIVVSVGDLVSNVVLAVVDRASEVLTMLFNTAGNNTVVASLRDAAGAVLATFSNTVVVAAGPQIDAVNLTPAQVRPGDTLNIELTGSRLPQGLLVRVEECGPVTEVLVGGSPSQRLFNCTFPITAQPGEQSATVGPVGSLGTPFEAVLRDFTFKLLAKLVEPSAGDTVVLREDFNGAAIDSALWSPVELTESYAPDYQVSGGAISFNSGGISSQGKRTVSGARIVVKVRMAVLRQEHQSLVQLVDTQTGDVISFGEYSGGNCIAGLLFASSGRYVLGNRSYGCPDPTTARAAGRPSNDWFDYEMAVAGNVVTVRRVSLDGTVTDVIAAETMPNSIEGRSFYLRMGTLRAEFARPVIDWVEVHAEAAPNASNGHRYEVIRCGTWTQCRDAARSLGAELATVRSEAENAWIARNLLPASQPYLGLWLGGTDAGSEGTWRWVGGEALAYSKWRSGEPNNSSGIENCMLMEVANSGEWNDGNCDSLAITQAVVEFPDVLASLPATGTANNGTRLPLGAADPRWRIISGPGFGAPGIPAVASEQHWLYFNTPKAAWLWATANAQAPQGEYVFRLEFDVGDVDPQTLALSGEWSADNHGRIFLNDAAASGTGRLVLPQGDTNNLPTSNPFRITSGFKRGVNTLDLRVTDTGAPGGVLAWNLKLLRSPAAAVPAPVEIVLPASAFTSGLNVAVFNEPNNTCRNGLLYNGPPYQMGTPNAATWTPNIAVAGNYRIEVAYAAQDSRPVSFKLDGAMQLPAAMATTTGSWCVSDLRRESLGVYALSAGSHALTFERPDVFPHFWKIYLTRLP